MQRHASPCSSAVRWETLASVADQPVILHGRGCTAGRRLQETSAGSTAGGGTNTYAWACYSDSTALLSARGFAENAFAPFAMDAEFDRALALFDLNFLLLVGLWIMVVVVTARTAGRQPGMRR
ncbi:hypothetical protein CQ013_07970 [Arthrobacter sp. MYb216]|nr:hypothetical protein CQ013_07970 [Arthrobacter sp. MYb216]